MPQEGSLLAWDEHGDHSKRSGCCCNRVRIGDPLRTAQLLKLNDRLMDKTEILKEAQQELMRHSWDTFVNDPPQPGLKGSVVPGCPVCRKILYTDHQYLSHLALDVLPKILKIAVDGSP